MMMSNQPPEIVHSCFKEFQVECRWTALYQSIERPPPSRRLRSSSARPFENGPKGATRELRAPPSSARARSPYFITSCLLGDRRKRLRRSSLPSLSHHRCSWNLFPRPFLVPEKSKSKKSLFGHFGRVLPKISEILEKFFKKSSLLYFLAYFAPLVKISAKTVTPMLHPGFNLSYILS